MATKKADTKAPLVVPTKSVRETGIVGKGDEEKVAKQSSEYDLVQVTDYNTDGVGAVRGTPLTLQSLKDVPEELVLALMDGKMNVRLLREHFPKVSEDDLQDLHTQFSKFCLEVDTCLQPVTHGETILVRENVWEKLVATLKTGRACVEDGQPGRELLCNVVDCTHLVTVINLKEIYAFSRVEPFDFVCAECQAYYS